MTSINRSRRLQAGLAGVSVLSALGAALGLGLTTHSQNQAQGNSGATGQRSARSDHGDDDGEESRGHAAQSTSPSTGQSGPVSPPANSAPQATTGGS